MNARQWSVLGAAMVLGFAAGALSACSDDTTNNGTPGDDGGGAEASDDGSPVRRDSGGGTTDAGSDSACPTYTGTDDYCKALHARCEKCSATMRACQIADLANCEQAGFSANVRSAVAACVSTITCSSGNSANNECLNQALSAAQPTAKQEEVRTAVCSVCAPDGGVQTCKDRFFFTANDAGVVTPGPGTYDMLTNDSYAQKLLQTCVPIVADAGAAGDGGASACLNRFFFCSLSVTAGAFPPSVCRDAGRD